MTDQEIVDGLINRDEKITDWFFNIKYRPLFINVIKLIFDYQVDYDECISELYYHLMKNDAAVLRNFEGRSTIGTWIKIVAIRFFREQTRADCRRLMDGKVDARTLAAEILARRKA